jgi:glutathione S-transferase
MPERHVLYQYESCPFCRRVLQFLAETRIRVEMRDILRDPEARRELVEGGGRATVPCLRIERDGEVHWLYESRDIIDYLRRQHAAA